MGRRKFNERPKGVGDIVSGKVGDNEINLDLLIMYGSRAQKRFALRQLKKLRINSGRR
jgi:hypothetical protein